MSQCSRFSLTEGKQVPLPQRTNDPIISIRSLDWCYTPLPFTPSLSFFLTYNLFPESHLDGVYVPPQVQYSMYKDGEEAALTVAEGDTTWAQTSRERSEWSKTIRSFLTRGQCFIFISTVGSWCVCATWNRLVSKSGQPVGRREVLFQQRRDSFHV